MSPAELYADTPTRKQLLADTLKCLHFGWRIEILGELRGGTAVLSRGYPYNDDWYVCDNGGEFNVIRINDREPCKSVPYTDFHLMLDGGTMAYRVWCAMQSEEIDYSFRLPEIIEDARKAA